MKKILIPLSILIVLILGACGGSGETESSLADFVETNEVAAAPALEGELAAEAELAIGSLLLDDTDFAITAEQAETLLPLWQAYQSLTTSGTAADIELEAIINQIEGEMSTEQIAAIQEMSLSEESIQELLQNGTIRLGGFGGENAAGEGGQGRGFGGGQLGGGPAGGGGGQGGGVQGLDPATIQTRQAERAADGGGAGAGIGRLTTGAVIRLLEAKTGVAQPDQQQAGFALIQTFSEAMGLPVQEIRGAMEEGQTFGEYAEANGDLEAVRTTLIESLGDLELPEGQTAETAVDAFLEREFQVRGGQGGQGNGGG